MPNTVGEDSPVEEVLDPKEEAVKKTSKEYDPKRGILEVKLPRFEEKSLEKFKRYKSSVSSSFNTQQSGEGSFNLNMEAGNEEVHEVRRPMGRDRAKKKAMTLSIPST
nr:hypothetical protein [Tanacetum cinerariifolium]